MSAEAFNPKFDINGAYTREEFVFRCEALIAQMAPTDELREILERNAKWAEELGKGDFKILWAIANDGKAVPYVEYGKLEIGPEGETKVTEVTDGI